MNLNQDPLKKRLSLLHPHLSEHLTSNHPELLDNRDEVKFVEHCGVCAVINSPSAVALVGLGLNNLQHRGQDGAGIATAGDDGRLCLARSEGKVAQFLQSPDMRALPAGRVAIGHTRYGTTGEQSYENIQPIALDIPSLGHVAIAHNGNLTNAHQLRAALARKGHLFKGTSDTEVILHLIAEAHLAAKEETSRNSATPSDLVLAALRQVTGSYSIAVLFPDAVVVARDPHGNRPLVMAKNGDTIIVASEPCGWDSFEVHNFIEIQPATITEISPLGEIVRELVIDGDYRRAPCLMELLYFARPDSRIFDTEVADFRRRMGELLYQRNPVEADLVIPLMSSGLHYALGFSEASGIPLRYSLTRNQASPRVFIEADPHTKYQRTLEKHSLNRQEIAGKRIVYVDDSIVKGPTLEKIVSLSYPKISPARTGASEVHIRIAAPPIVGPCHYGINTPLAEELAVNKWGGYSGSGEVDVTRAGEAVRTHLGVDSVGFGTLADVNKALTVGTSKSAPRLCDACFRNDYTIIPPPRIVGE